MTGIAVIAGIAEIWKNQRLTTEDTDDTDQKGLAVTAPTSFQPNLDQLDAVIRSLELKQ